MAGVDLQETDSFGYVRTSSNGYETEPGKNKITTPAFMSSFKPASSQTRFSSMEVSTVGKFWPKKFISGFRPKKGDRQVFELGNFFWSCS